MKPTARIINVGLLVRLVLSRETADVGIINKPPEKRHANRRVKPCKGFPPHNPYAGQAGAKDT